jgi:hypothetical protein
MVKIEGSVIKEQGVTFALVIVKRHVLCSKQRAENARRSFSTLFPGMPIILMAQDARGVPTYWGRRDIVNCLASIHISQIPWKIYTFQ